MGINEQRFFKILLFTCRMFALGINKETQEQATAVDQLVFV